MSELNSPAGINDVDKDRELITYEYAPKADAMIFVLDVSRGFTRFEKEFFDGLSDTSKDKVFVVFNKIDTVECFSKDNLDRLLKAGNINNAKGFGLSAKFGMKGVLENSGELIEDSGINEFKTVLVDYVNNRESRQAVKQRKQKLIERAYLLCKTELESHLSGLKMNASQIDDELNKLTSELNRETIERDKKLNEFENKYNNIKNEIESLISNFREDFMDKYLAIDGLSKKREYLQNPIHQQNMKLVITKIQNLLENGFQIAVGNDMFEPDGFIFTIVEIIDSLSGFVLLFGDDIMSMIKNTTYSKYVKQGMDLVLKGASVLNQLIMNTAITDKVLDNKVTSVFDKISDEIEFQFIKIKNTAKMNLNLEVEKIEASIAGFIKTKSEIKNESEILNKKIESLTNLIEILNNTYRSEMKKIN